MKAAADREFVAMRRITETLAGLSEAERARVLAYVNHRANDPVPAPKPTQMIQPIAQGGLVGIGAGFNGTSQEQPALL